MPYFIISSFKRLHKKKKKHVQTPKIGIIEHYSRTYVIQDTYRVRFYHNSFEVTWDDILKTNNLSFSFGLILYLCFSKCQSFPFSHWIAPMFGSVNFIDIFQIMYYLLQIKTHTLLSSSAYLFQQVFQKTHLTIKSLFKLSQFSINNSIQTTLLKLHIW